MQCNNYSVFVKFTIYKNNCYLLYVLLKLPGIMKGEYMKIFLYLLIGCNSLVFSAYSSEEYEYEFNYGRGFFFQYQLSDSLEDIESKKAGNALKVLERHSNLPYGYLSQSWNNVVLAHQLVKDWYENGSIDRIIFNDVQRSYNFLYGYMYLNSLTDHDHLVRWVQDRESQFQRWRKDRIERYHLLAEGQSDSRRFHEQWDLDRDIEREYFDKEREIEFYRNNFYRSQSPEYQKPPKGFWILLLALLLAGAAQGSEPIENAQIESSTKPSVSEYIQQQETPLETVPCSSIFMK